jgi:hypothetical protein
MFLEFLSFSEFTRKIDVLEFLSFLEVYKEHAGVKFQIVFVVLSLQRKKVFWRSEVNLGLKYIGGLQWFKVIWRFYGGFKLCMNSDYL